MTKKQIDKAIEHLSLEIIRGEGYCYFLSTLSAVTETGEVAGDQIGESVPACFFKQLTVERWVWEATYAREVQANDSYL